MKKIITTMLLTLISVIALCQTPQYVNGYRKSNGTYVQGYYRTSANHTVRDNYSTKGNVNPYTNKRGTRTYYTSNNSQKTYRYNRSRR